MRDLFCLSDEQMAQLEPYSPKSQAQARKRSPASFWRMNEIDITVKGRWAYLYRAVHRDG